MHERLDDPQNRNLVEINAPRQAHTASLYQYTDEIHYSNGLDIAITVSEVSFHDAPSLSQFRTKHAGGKSSTHVSQIQEADICNTMNGLTLLPFDGDPAMHNTSSTWIEVDFDFDIQNLSTDGVDLFGPSYAAAVVSPSTIFPAGLSPLAQIGSEAVLSQSCAHVTAASPAQPVIARNRLHFFYDHPGYFKSYSRHSDIRRHALSHNTAASLFFCRYAGCRRGMRGFLRKNKLMAHVNAVHEG